MHVLYCDWELSGEDHRYRLGKLFGSDLPPVHYMLCDRPLVHESDRISREVRRLGIDYLICDSVAFGTAGPPEAAEFAMQYCRAMRQIGVGSLHLAHVTKSENADQRPFGSAFWHNSARSTWYVKAAEPGDVADVRHVVAYNRKNNLGALSRAVGFQVTFGDRWSIAPVNAADVRELADTLPVWQRIQNALKAANVPLTLLKLAEETGAKQDTIEKEIRRKSGLFTRVASPDGIQRFALVERRAS
jgi:hypothetical protein